MSCKCCGSSTSTDSSCKKSSSSYCSSSSSSSSEDESCKYRKKKSVRTNRRPAVWEEGVDGYYDDYCSSNDGSCNKIAACHNISCGKISKHHVDKKKHCFPKVSTNLLDSCQVNTCLVNTQCLRAKGAEIGDINVTGKLYINGKDINNEEESVIVSNFIGSVQQPPLREQDALLIPEPTPVPQGVIIPVAGNINLPNYVALYNIPDRRGIRNLNELKELYSKIILINVGDVARQVSFVLFVYSANSVTLDPNNPGRTYTLQPLDIDVQTLIPGGIGTFTVNWKSIKSSLNIIRDATEVAIFTAVMVPVVSNLAFLRTILFSSQSLSYNLYAVYNNYCTKDDNRCDDDRGRGRCRDNRCGSDDEGLI
nr:putative membrane protein [Cedratvirus lena]